MAAGWNTKRNYNGNTDNDDSQTLSYSNLPRQSFEQEVSESVLQTPPSKTGRASRVKGINAPRIRPSIRDAFDDPFAENQERSNSNDLSWSPKHARNSVVDDMLLSLDNIRTEPISSLPYDTNTYTPTKERGISSQSTRSRGHTVSSVSSSDYSSTYDTPSPQFPRHRSNSSANFRSSLGRIDSVRLTGQEEDSRPIYPRSSARNRGTGRDSGSSSLELERPEPRFKANRRSQSFDHGYLRMAIKNSIQDPFVRDDSDAAVPPSIPVNPRIQPLVASLPSNVNGNLLSANGHRRGSNRSSIRPVVSPDSQPSNAQQNVSREFNPAANTQEKSTFGSGNMSTSMPKENQKPGFFRRMFGSSSGPSQKEEITQQKRNLQRTAQPLSSGSPEDIADPQQYQSSQRIASKDKPLKDSQQLNKKTSFFRRRRKSVQESPVPQLPQVGTERDEPTAGPDSPGSLQKVMDQFYPNHRRIDSKGSVITSRRKNSLQPSSMPMTIRSVGGPSVDDHIGPPLIVAPRPSIDQDYKSAKEKEHRRSLSNGSKLDSRENGKLLPNERSKHSPSHTRTQSDIDKNLPRLPVDYTAVTSNADKEVPTSRYNNTAAKAATLESPAPRAPTVSTSLTQSKQGSVENAKIVAPSSSQDDRSEPAYETKAAITSIETQVMPIEDHAVESDELADETKEAMMFSIQNVDGPTQEQRDCARKLYDGTFGIDRSEVAPWLGEADPERSNIREAYMELFDWKDMSILGALRSFCSHVQVKGETQQVDRLLDAISRRWCECNSKHGFKATDVVHTICYSILLLNTDLHMADIESKMTRNQFIKNTMPTIRRVVIDAAPHAFDNARSSMLPPPRRQTEPATSSGGFSNENSTDIDGRPVHRLQSRPSDHSGYDASYDNDDCGPLVKSSFYGKIGAWETQVEVVLKNFYNSIRNQRLPLSGGCDEERRIDPQQSTLSLAATTNGILRRTNSMLSKAGSETVPNRGRMTESRLGGRWSSKVRSRPRLYPSSLAQSRTSIDDDQSAISPSMSSMWSRHSIGKTSMSVTSFASGFPNAEYQRSIGFANALSQAITRSDSADESTEDLLRVGPLLEDESLELEGAPWAKEGILKHKHHLEAVDKKAKDRNWTECFAVIEKGWIRLFQFNMNSKSIRQRSQRMMGGGVVGGGNWMESAQSLGQFLLRHTIASALPPPGYSKARPHVWALSLPSGAVHLFQAGTPEIVKEFVSTANYWSARLSKEPLIGGVSNIEYGWSERVINMALVDSSRPPSAVPGHRPSVSQSIRTSFEQASTRVKLPGDKIVISDWTPPTQSMMASQLLEVDQLHALQIYVQNIEEELRKHNELRSAMLLAFTPRQSNHVRAMTNWEKKSSYLLREIVKFSTYLESLQYAQKEMERVKAEKETREEDKKQQQNEVHDADGTSTINAEVNSVPSRGNDSVAT